MLSEALSTKSSLRNAATLSPEEDSWLKEINVNQQSNIATNPPHKARWDVRLEEQEFIKWRSAIGAFSLTGH